jgi:hypothetical protein
MRRNIVIIGVVISVIAISMFIFGGLGLHGASDGIYTAEQAIEAWEQNKEQLTVYVAIGFIGFILLFVGIPLAIVGAVMKSKKQKKIVLTLNCPKCGREIPFDAKVCTYCQYEL